LTATVALGSLLAERNRGRQSSGIAPDFTLQLFDGSELRLSELRGQVVLLNFWASWCPPCRAEAPELQALHERYHRAGLRIIGINMLESSRAKALDFVAEFRLSYPNGEDLGQRAATLYRVEGPPESFLIDRSGEIRRFYLGNVRYDPLAAAIENLLAEPV